MNFKTLFLLLAQQSQFLICSKRKSFAGFLNGIMTCWDNPFAFLKLKANYGAWLVLWSNLTCTCLSCLCFYCLSKHYFRWLEMYYWIVRTSSAVMSS